MKRYICHSESCVWYKIAPDPKGNQMDTPTCHHPNPEDFVMVFPLKDDPGDAWVCRRFKEESDEQKIVAKIDEHSARFAASFKDSDGGDAT